MSRTTRPQAYSLSLQTIDRVAAFAARASNGNNSKAAEKLLNRALDREEKRQGPLPQVEHKPRPKYRSAKSFEEGLVDLHTSDLLR